MKFSCDKKLLMDAVSGVSKAVIPSSAVPVLQGVLLKGDGFQLELTGYDLEMSITTKIEANIIEPGEIVLPARLLSDMVRGLAADEVEIEADENLAVKLKSGITEYDLMGLSAADYPELPEPGADEAFEIDAAELAMMIKSTIYAVSTDDKKPAHTGELFSIEPGELTVVALDGFRLAIAKHPISTEREISIVVPAKTAGEVSRIMGEEGQPVQVAANRRYVVFSNGKFTVTSRLIESEFLNYKTVLPQEYKTKVTVDVDTLEMAIGRCAAVISEKIKNPLRLTFSDGIELRCQTAQGKVSDKIEAVVEGETVEIGFNYRFLLDALRNSGCERLILEISGPLSPVKLMPPEGDEFLFLVLPVRFKND